MSDFAHGDQTDHRASLEQKHVHRDVETGSPSPTPTYELKGYYASNHNELNSDSVEIVKAKELRSRGFFKTLRDGEEWLDAKMGIETQGIDRIHEEDKKPPSILNVFFLWWSMTCHVGTLPIGILGPEFGLSLGQSVAATVVGTMLGALCTAYCGTLGPKLGLRAIATSRYSFGYYGAKLCSILNVVIGGGFAVVNVVVVGQMLSAVSNYTMTIAVGCVIIAVLSYLISIFGFALIHTYEKYSWIATFILMLVLIGQVGDNIDAGIEAESSGLELAGRFLTILSINFSSASGWCSIASDYYCNYPATTKSWKIFFLTFFGVSIPTIFVTVIGACLGNAAVSSTANPIINDAYKNHGLGGLLSVAYHPTGWAKFCLVLLTFSVLGNNIAVNYSSGLSLQLLGHYFHAIPRFIWSLLNAIVIAVLAIAGREHLSTIVSNFVSMLGYWTVSFTIILLIEDQFFRKRDARAGRVVQGPAPTANHQVGEGGDITTEAEPYDLTIWDVPSRLPPGIAAVLALLTGYLAGGVTGMSQTWYVGPIAAAFGGGGGDVGVYLSLVFTCIVYPPARWWERRVTGR